MDKSWRPENWPEIKKRIGDETQVVFSPSKGQSGGTKDQIIEVTASALMEAILTNTEAASVETQKLL